jgi:hypothetical protein
LRTSAYWATNFTRLSSLAINDFLAIWWRINFSGF